MSAVVTLVHMPTESRRAAGLDGAHDPPLRAAHAIAMSVAVRRTMQTKVIGNLKRRLAHRSLPSRQPRFSYEPALCY
jgi:hypothetical protein